MNGQYFVVFQVQFSIIEDTTLANLLALNLHNVEDDVRNIVDKAVKELGIEKVNPVSFQNFILNNFLDFRIPRFLFLNRIEDNIVDRQYCLW